MNVIAAALKNVYDKRETITRGVRIAWEAPLMRHLQYSWKDYNHRLNVKTKSGNK